MGGVHGTKVAVLQERVRSLEARLAKSESVNKPLVEDNAAYQKTIEALDSELSAVKMERGILAQQVKDLQKVINAPLRELKEVKPK